jgi:hypothetical protein
VTLTPREFNRARRALRKRETYLGAVIAPRRLSSHANLEPVVPRPYK